MECFLFLKQSTTCRTRTHNVFRVLFHTWDNLIDNEISRNFTRLLWTSIVSQVVYHAGLCEIISNFFQRIDQKFNEKTLFLIDFSAPSKPCCSLVTRPQETRSPQENNSAVKILTLSAIRELFEVNYLFSRRAEKQEQPRTVSGGEAEKSPRKKSIEMTSRAVFSSHKSCEAQ